MLVYINYPNPHFGVHGDPSCPRIQMHGKPDQRVCHVSTSNLGEFLSDLIEEKLRFEAQSGYNDLWMEVSLDTPEQEIGLVHVVQALLGRRYRPLSNAPIEVHCHRA